MWTWFKIYILNRRFILNKRSGEVHSIELMGQRCGNVAEHNRKYISYSKFKKLKGKKVNRKTVNGCYWCMRKYDIKPK
jgi:hypothetical protein